MVARLTYINALTPSGVSQPADDPWKKAWELTRQISAHPEVKKADRDAYGEPSNDFNLVHALGPVVPKAPWAVHLTDLKGLYWLLPFDFDVADGSPDAVEAAQDDADALSILLGQLSVPHLLCESSSKGGRHVWIGLADPAPVELTRRIGQAAKLILPSLDWGMLSNATQGAARPPLSPHRNGSYSRPLRGSVDALIMPTTTIAELEQLLIALEERAPQRPASNPVIRTVAFGDESSALRGQGLEHLNTPGGGENPSWTGWMCLLNMASAGWDFTAVQDAARTAPGMETYRTRRAGNRGERRPRSVVEMENRLASQWEKALSRAAIRRTLPAASGEPKDLSELAAQVELVDDLETRFRVNPGRWGGRYGASTRKTVLRALGLLTLVTGKTRVAAATRTLAELCNIDQSTAARALVQLQAEGWIRQAAGSEGINAATWQLTPPSHFSTASEPGATQPSKNTPPPSEMHTKRKLLIETLETHLASIRHDLFTYQGLGHLAGHVWADLRSNTETSVAHLAAKVGIGTTHAALVLSKLRRHRLLKKTGERWTASARDLRDRAAEALGVEGTIQRRTERYEDDRKIWRWWCAELDRMTTTPRERPRQRHVTDRPLTWVDAEDVGEWEWPLYPRAHDDPRGRGDHRMARAEVEAGYLSPSARWQLPRAA